MYCSVNCGFLVMKLPKKKVNYLQYNGNICALDDESFCRLLVAGNKRQQKPRTTDALSLPVT